MKMNLVPGFSLQDKDTKVKIATATILVVEDENIVAKDIQSRLRNLGYVVPALASCGKDAVKKAAEIKPDLVLMDIRLKGDMDGIEAAKQIYTTLQIPVVYLTAYADDDTLERAKVTEPFSYIIKPFDKRELHTAIEIALYKHQMERQLKENEQWLLTVLESIGDAVITNDAKGCVTFMNPSAEALTGWKQEDSIGKDSTEIFNIVHEVTRTPIESPVAKVLREGSIVNSLNHTLLLTKDGKEIPIHDTVAPIKDDTGTIRGAVVVFQNLTERKQAEEQLHHNAFHDALTDLPNRALFMDRLRHAVARAKRYEDYLFAVLFVDCDRFKVINDSLGHLAGDQLLIALASRLQECLRASDTVARFGGDEFAILLEDIPDISIACRAADRIQQELTIPFTLNGHEVFTSVSIGIALSSPSYNQAEDLLRDADIALYRAKALGKARYQVFDTTMHGQVVALLQLENDLRRAIERWEFRVHYQPIISLANSTLIGFEALVRWQHPERGLVSPAQFISVAEETGQIILIDRLVLRSACHQMRAWQEQVPASPPLIISVNLSSKQFAQPNLVEQIQQILQETGLDAHNLRLEITESAIIQNTESATITLSQLKVLGIKLCIDDFGTGYSSLSYLHRFPVDVMKIDRSFISSLDINSDKLEIVRTIVMLAHNLGMDVVAEGVETVEQLDRIQALQCAYAQGYYFAKPLDKEAAGALLGMQCNSH